MHFGKIWKDFCWQDSTKSCGSLGGRLLQQFGRCRRQITVQEAPNCSVVGGATGDCERPPIDRALLDLQLKPGILYRKTPLSINLPQRGELLRCIHLLSLVMLTSSHEFLASMSNQRAGRPLESIYTQPRIRV